MPTNIYLANAPHVTAEESYDEIKKLMYPKGEFGRDILECPDYIEVTFKQQIIESGVTVDERVAISTASIISFGEINEARISEPIIKQPGVPMAPAVREEVDAVATPSPVEADEAMGSDEPGDRKEFRVEGELPKGPMPNAHLAHEPIPEEQFETPPNAADVFNPDTSQPGRGAGDLPM